MQCFMIFAMFNGKMSASRADIMKLAGLWHLRLRMCHSPD